VSQIPAPINDDTGNFNGNAWDEGTNRFYFTEFGAFQTPTHQGPTELYFNDLAGNQTYAGDLTGGVSCGAFYEGKYYYFPDRMDDFYEVTFNASGTIASNTKIADVLGSSAPYSLGHWIAFGDIAIAEDGTVYGSATDFGGTLPNYTAVFFRMNLDGTGYTEITTGGEIPLTYKLELEQRIYSGERQVEVLKLGVYGEDREESLAYAWTEPTSMNIGMNLRWFQAGCTKR